MWYLGFIFFTSPIVVFIKCIDLWLEVYSNRVNSSCESLTRIELEFWGVRSKHFNSSESRCHVTRIDLEWNVSFCFYRTIINSIWYIVTSFLDFSDFIGFYCVPLKMCAMLINLTAWLEQSPARTAGVGKG